MFKSDIIAKRLNLTSSFINEFESHVLLGYTGINRNSSDFYYKINKKINEKK